MRIPKTLSLGIRLPALREAFPASAPGPVTSLLSKALAGAFWVLALATLASTCTFIFMAFAPLGPMGLTVSSDGGGTSVPVPRAYILFALGAVTAYLGGFALILRDMRALVRAMGIGDPFQSPNVGRLKQIGGTLAVVTGGAWAGQALVSRLVRGELDPPDLFDLVTPAFSVLVVLVVAQVFREGARLRRDSELTI